MRRDRKPWSIVKPDYYKKETSRWIVFPWEIKETIRKIIKKCRVRGMNIEYETAKLVDAGISDANLGESGTLLKTALLALLFLGTITAIMAMYLRVNEI